MEFSYKAGERLEQIILSQKIYGWQVNMVRCLTLYVIRDFKLKEHEEIIYQNNEILLDTY